VSVPGKVLPIHRLDLCLYQRAKVKGNAVVLSLPLTAQDLPTDVLTAGH
jgi:hypothetical protein